MLILLSFDEIQHLRPTQIAESAVKNGRAEIRKWNLASILIKAKPYVLRFDDGWMLSPEGKDRVASILSSPGSTKKTAQVLRKELAKIADPCTKAFIEEAVSCLEHDLKRAAVVFSWAGAVSLLYDHVLKNRIAEFNAEAVRRDPKWRSAKTKDDLARMKESDFLDILAAISMMGKNAKEHLKNTCLNIRNSCGHPNSFKLGKHTVEAHLEALVLNVFQRF